MADLFPGVAGALDDPDEKLSRLRSGAQMHLRGQNAQYRPRPGKTAFPVGDHLALVDDGHIVTRADVQLLGRGGDMGVALAHVLLLAGGQRALHAHIQKRLLRLQRQQAQR